jgi:hypothetical protein
MIGGKDPADMVREDVAKLRKIIGGAKPIVEYLLDILEAQMKDDRHLKLQVREEVLPLLSLIQNKIDQDHFEGIIAERLSTTKEAIHYEVEHFAQSQKEKTVKAAFVVGAEKAVPTPVLRPIRKNELLQYLALLATLVGGRKKELIDSTLHDLLGKTSDEITEAVPVEVKSGLIFTLESYLAEMPKKHIAEELADKCNELRRTFAKEEIVTLREKVALAESEGDEQTVLMRMEEIIAIQKKAEEGRFETEQFI